MQAATGTTCQPGAARLTSPAALRPLPQQQHQQHQQQRRHQQRALVCYALDPSLLQEIIIGSAVVTAVVSSLLLANREEPKVCPSCAGTGGVVCFACNGSGRMEKLKSSDGRAARDPMGRAPSGPARNCRACKGSGKIFCRTCKGSGFV